MIGFKIPYKLLIYRIMKMENKHGINQENIDKSIKPSDNFYMYACGGWKEKHPLEAEYSRFGTFDLLRENARQQLKELILGLNEHPDVKTQGTIAQKVYDIYVMGMDEERLNREKAEPIRDILNNIDNMTEDDFMAIVATIHKGVGSPFFSTGVSTDAMNSDYNVMHVAETGLGLGDRDYYLVKSEEHDRILKAYRKYIKKISNLAGYDDERAERIADSVLKIETEFAVHTMTREDRRDPMKRYNPMSYEELKKKFKNIDWDRYFELLGVEKVKKVIVTSPQFIEFIDSYLPSLSLEEKKDLMIAEVISGSTGLLSDDFQEASFEMYDKVLSGIEEQEPRWKRAMRIPNSMFGEAVGALYVEKYFPKENKEKMLEIVGNLKNSLRKHIESLEWMSEPTKKMALEKLDTFKVKVGYPDKWKDYSAIEINPELSYAGNVRKAAEWYVADNYSKMDKPVDKEEWHMTPQTVNAYYNPTTNEICFPAGILQPPYFDITAEDAVNYGAIGVVIGHEMTHGFDDSGRKFDKNGNLNNWWNEEDSNNFTALAERLTEQFNKVEVAPGVYCNGKFTLGENIADQGGLRVALTAYLDSAKENGSQIIDGFSPLQRFYLSYAGVWADNIREEEILLRTKTDPHSLGVNRVNVTLKNIDEFMEAFSIKEGDEMFRPKEERVVIW